MLEIIVLGLVSIINLLLGLVVYLKNPRGDTNRFFFMLTLVLIMWSISNYISVHPIFFDQLICIRLVLFFGALLTLSVFLTFQTFPATVVSPKYYWRIKWSVGITIVAMALTLTPLVFKSLKVSNGNATPIPAPGIVLFLAQTAILLGGCVVTVIVKYRSSVGVAKAQLRLVLLGVAGTFGLIIFSNLLLVVVFKVTVLVPFGPAFTLIFSSAFTYAIIRRRLFDIKRTAARGLAYVLTITTLAVIYSFTVFGLSSVFITSNKLDANEEAIYTAVALLLAFSFQRIKQFFDYVSNNFFFKDDYEPQVFLDKLNRVLVTHIELKQLLADSITIIERNMKSQSCIFVIRKTDTVPARIVGNRAAIHFNEKDIEDMRPLLVHARQKVIVTDYLEEKDAELSGLLGAKNMAVIVRLVPSLDFQSEGVGDIVLGPKKSGDPYNPGDIKVLEIIANELVIAIQNALRFEEIENFNLTLQGRVDQATRKIRRVNDKLRDLDETKDDFISMASHQLRTPLTSVKGYLSMVLEEDAGKLTPMQREMLGQAFFSSQRMVYLIADLLNVSRLKTGKFIIESTRVNLAKIVQQELEQLKETAASRQLTLYYDKPANFPDLMLDETKTRQVIMNFVDNAIYYTPAGGHITVKLIDNPNSIELTVEDSGIGVPKAEQHHLFTKFYRAGNARQARPDGTGLGLFMAKKVVIAQEGSLIFNSQEGKGSVFGFVFSKTKLAAQPSHPKSSTGASAKKQLVKSR